MKSKLKSFAVAVVLVLGVSLTIPSVGVSAASTYSCGTYGAGSYSQGGGSCNAITAPNTGYDAVKSQLAQPSILIPIIASILAIVAGIVIIVRRKRNA